MNDSSWRHIYGGDPQMYEVDPVEPSEESIDDLIVVVVSLAAFVFAIVGGAAALARQLIRRGR